jgi:D-serine deaminase-like pyridoxal phosphate-dependent protein
LARQLELFRREGLHVDVVSGGSTPSAFYSHLVENLTEIRPGTYIFNDRNTVLWGACTQDQCAAFVWTTVVSTAVSGQAVIDGGSKTFSGDGLAPGNAAGYGIVSGYPEIEFSRMNEEHGYLQLPAGLALEVGQPLRVIPNHICTAVNLHDRVWGIRQDEVVEEWEVAARGRIR